MTTQELERIGVSRVFMRFFSGFGAGFIGTIILGLILMLTWSIVGDVLSPSDKSDQLNEFGVSLNQSPSTHPLFLGVIILGVFLGTLVATLSNTMLKTTLESKFQHKSTNIIQVFLGNMVLLVMFVPIYLSTNGLHGSDGIGLTALVHTTLVALFAFMVLEIVSTARKHLIISLYGGLFGVGLYLWIITLIGVGSPAVIAFLTLPILLGCIGAGSAITQMFYFWTKDTYNNDFLDGEKRFGDDYSNINEDRNKIRDEAL